MRSSLARSLGVRVVGLVLLPAAVTSAVALLLAGVEPFVDRPRTLLALVLAVFAVAATGAAVVAARLGAGLGRRLQQLQLGAELMATVNPHHRLDLHTRDEFQTLADEINRMADRVGEAHAGLEAETARATRELSIERGKLSAVLEALGEGVALAAPDGRVILANPAAHVRLGTSRGGLLGRSLFDASRPWRGI